MRSINISEFKNLINSSEEILMDKVLNYAMQQNYTKYTSTFKEAWRLSISGLSEALINAIESNASIPEMGPDDDFVKDRIAEFGILEAKKHRSRGVTLGMFLGLFKYYHQSYIDLMEECDFSSGEKAYYAQYIKRYFDHVELGFIMEWTGLTKTQEFEELQEINRRMTNEKNKYLLVFGSIYDPIILVDKNNNIENINSRAAELFWGDSITGRNYFCNIEPETVPDWLEEELLQFSLQNDVEIMTERTIDTRAGKKTFMVKFRKMLDISEKYSGTVIILYDITERIKIENELKIHQEKLEKYAFTDQMTGISNRRTGLMLLEKELASLSSDNTILSVCYIDVDGLKKVNDTYGHAEGDKLIKVIAAGIQDTIRKEDTVSRIGGDEFLVIFPKRRRCEAEEAVKKIKNQLQEYDGKSDKKYKHSFSYGVLEVSDGNNLSANDVLKAVDKKMYQNKYMKKSLVYLSEDINI